MSQIPTSLPRPKREYRVTRRDSPVQLYKPSVTTVVPNFSSAVSIPFSDDSVAFSGDGVAYAAIKRLLDVFVAAFLLITFSPLILLVCVAIKLTDGGAVLFSQTRVGRNGRLFRCFKFRSMVVNAEELKSQLAALNDHDDPRTFKMANDPRITRVGVLLRRFSIDEFPQVVNVLMGDMSLVGPRPPLPDEVAMYDRHDRRRLEVKPGLTCIWQVSGRSRISFPEQVNMDIDYIRRRSLLFDLKLIAKTVPVVISGDGAS